MQPLASACATLSFHSEAELRPQLRPKLGLGNEKENKKQKTKN